VDSIDTRSSDSSTRVEGVAIVVAEPPVGSGDEGRPQLRSREIYDAIRRTGELSVASVVGRLRGDLRTVADAHRVPNAGGLPESAGLYAWWMVPGLIPGVTGPSHPAQPFELLYVGIAPKDAQSRATLRSRIRGQHLGGNIGSSTFRQSLAALLFEAMGWTTRWSGSRAQLSREDNGALSDLATRASAGRMG